MTKVTNKFLDEYSAGEFLDWLSNEYADEYIKQEISENNGETIINDVFDIEQLKTNFLYTVRRYVVVKRGYKFYIHDERNCTDIMMFKYTEADKEEVQNHVYNVCEDLNQGKINFIGRKYRCD